MASRDGTTGTLFDCGGGGTDPHRIPVTVPTHRQRIRYKGTSMNETLDVYEQLAAAES